MNKNHQFLLDGLQNMKKLTGVTPDSFFAGVDQRKTASRNLVLDSPQPALGFLQDLLNLIHEDSVETMKEQFLVWAKDVDPHALKLVLSMCIEHHMSDIFSAGKLLQEEQA